MVLSAIENDINLNKSFSSLTHLDIIQLETKLYQRGMSVNGIGVYMRTFRAVCNKAIYQDIVGIEHYPFRKYKIRKEKTVPRVLDIDEVKRYFHLNLDQNNSLYLSWLIGKLIFMLRGINLKDLLLLSSKNIKNKHLIYHRKKTRKVYSVKLNDEVLAHLNELWSINLKSDKYEQRRKLINTHLKKLGKMIKSSVNVTTYVFRYSYANTCRELGYSKELIAEALGHEYGNAVTGIYLECFDQEKLDNMNFKVLELIRG